MVMTIYMFAIVKNTMYKNLPTLRHAQHMAPQSIASIQTTLTSLTTMIQPDGKVHTVHVSKELGMCRESEHNDLSALTTASSPLLWIHPGLKVYLIVYNRESFVVVLLKSKTHGFPDELSIQMQFKTRSLLTIEVSERDVITDNVSVLFCNKILSDVQDKTNFYVKVSFTQL